MTSQLRLMQMDLTVDMLDRLNDGIDTLQELDDALHNVVDEYVQERVSGSVEDTVNAWLACEEREPEEGSGTIHERMQQGVQEYVDTELKYVCQNTALVQFYTEERERDRLTSPDYVYVIDRHAYRGTEEGFEAYLSLRMDKS